MLLRALLSHGMAHALVRQSAGHRPLAPVDQEYLAAALELDLMEPRWRDAPLAASPTPPTRTSEGLFDLMI